MCVCVCVCVCVCGCVCAWEIVFIISSQNANTNREDGNIEMKEEEEENGEKNSGMQPTHVARFRSISPSIDALIASVLRATTITTTTTTRTFGLECALLPSTHLELIAEHYSHTHASIRTRVSAVSRARKHVSTLEALHQTHSYACMRTYCSPCTPRRR